MGEFLLAAPYFLMRNRRLIKTSAIRRAPSQCDRNGISRSLFGRHHDRGRGDNCKNSGDNELIQLNFYTTRASPIQQDYIRPAGRKLELGDIGWHTFRHTYRSWLDLVGTTIGVQQKLMRHAQLATTMNVYGNSMMESKREANSKVVQMALRQEVGRAQ